METIFKSNVLESFSKEKIVKSLKRFGITLSEIELHELIAQSYSVEEVKNALIEKFHPKPLVVSNLSYFIARYWQLTVPEKWSAEKVIEMMDDPDFSFGTEDYSDQFDDHIELFKQIKEIHESLEQEQNSDLKTQFEKALLYWVPRIVYIYQEIQDYSDEARNMFKELNEFIQKNRQIMESMDYKKELNFIKARLLYMNQKQVKAFEYLDKLQQEGTEAHEIWIQKLHLLQEEYDTGIAEQLYSEVDDILDSKENLLEEETVDEIINYFIDFRLMDEVNAKRITALMDQLESLLPTDDESTQLDHNEIYEFDDEDDEFDDEDDEDDEDENDDDEPNNSIISMLDKEIDNVETSMVLDEILFSEDLLPITFECVTCGLTYEQKVERVFIPYNWNDQIREKETIEENGIVLFDCEIACPICASFKYMVNIQSKMLLISLMVHITKMQKEGDYDPVDASNKVLIGNFSTKFTRETNSMRESISKLRELLRKDPESEELMESMGDSFLWMNNYTEGLKVFKKITERNERNIEAWLNLVKIYYNRKNANQCDKVVDKVLEVLGTDKKLFEANKTYLVYMDEFVHKMNNLKSIKKMKRLFKQFGYD